MIEALHASAPAGYKCADCTMDKEPCPDCYTAWWTKRHPNTVRTSVSHSGTFIEGAEFAANIVERGNTEKRRSIAAEIRREAARSSPAPNPAWGSSLVGTVPSSTAAQPKAWMRARYLEGKNSGRLRPVTCEQLLDDDVPLYLSPSATEPRKP